MHYDDDITVISVANACARGQHVVRCFFVSEWTSVEEKWTTASAMDREIRQIDVSSADYYKTVENFKTKLDFLQKTEFQITLSFLAAGSTLLAPRFRVSAVDERRTISRPWWWQFLPAKYDI